MKHFVKIYIKTTNKTGVILKLNKINVDIKNIKYLKDGIIADILYEDYKRCKKYLISYKIKVIDEVGVYKLKNNIKKNSLFIISGIFSVIVFLLLSNIIVKVNVIHESRELRDIISDSLRDKGVSALTFKKSYNEYEMIIEEIKEEYKDKIEWLEIDVDGMVINVRVEERIINKEQEEKGFCHIVAAKPGVIRSVITEKGVSMVKSNDFVRAGDILISGEIKLNEEVKENVCAKGTVYAEVWYNVSVSLPLKYVEENKTGKMRYNLMVKNSGGEHIILKPRVEDASTENKYLFNVFGNRFYLQKDYEVKREVKEYTTEEAIQKARELVHEKLSVKEIKNEDIIDEKYLKKSINNGNLDIDMFIAVKEQIGVKTNYEVETDSDTNDEQHNEDPNNIN